MIPTACSVLEALIGSFAEHGLEHADHLRPRITRPVSVFRPLCIPLVREREFASVGLWANLHRDAADIILRLSLDAPSEDQSARPVQFQVGAHVIDLFAVVPHEEREAAVHLGIRINAQHLLFA